MRSARLLGRQHDSLGALAAVSEGHAAICLSRGGARKLYAHTEPNEDAVLFAIGEAGSLIAVADGHYGASGSQLAIELLETRFAAQWTAPSGGALASVESWREAALDVLLACNAGILAHAAERSLPPAPTTLSLALVRARDGLLGYASIGDSHIFRADRAGVVDRGAASRPDERTHFLGDEAETRESALAKAAIGRESSSDLLAVVVASDGLSELGVGVDDPSAAVAEALAEAREVALELRALDACKRVALAAIASHRSRESGDNIGCGVLWLGD